MLKQLWRDQEALTSVEYALLIALLAIGGLLAWSTLASRLSASATASVNAWPDG